MFGVDSIKVGRQWKIERRSVLGWGVVRRGGTGRGVKGREVEGREVEDRGVTGMEA